VLNITIIVQLFSSSYSTGMASELAQKNYFIEEKISSRSRY